MKIGIDIDNVIANFDDTLLKAYLAYDKKLRNTGIINENPEYIRKGMFDWTEEEENYFYQANIERIARSLEPLEDAPYYIKKLKEDGHEIYLISGRDNGEYHDPKELTKAWLKKYDIMYDHLILTNSNQVHEKTQISMTYQIDLMIEDSISICLDLKKYGIPVYKMNTRYNQKENGLECVSSWKDIYQKITHKDSREEKEKRHIILDTDTYNECDDQFALAYLLKYQDQFEIDAITVAPYHHDHSISIEEGMNKSYEEIQKIGKWLNVDLTNKVWKGATDYFKNDRNQENEAVNKIIEIVSHNEKTYILAIGAITNVALAIKKEPSIVEKIEVIWLGSHSFLKTKDKEFNMKQDVQAVKEVFSSKVALTVIPCRNVASNLRTSIYELEHFLKGKNPMCDYLCQRFYNDGIHGIQERRVIWDISVIAYMIHKDWFETQEISCPKINEETLSYEITQDSHKITFVNYLEVDAIFKDLFEKLGEKNDF